MNDLASGTSCAATKLIHGGLRYLEHYEFRLVRESLLERETLWRIAPHIIWPLRFVLPHHAGLRPAWLLRLGLFVYDHLGRANCCPPPPTRISFENRPVGEPLKGEFHKAFEYADCWWTTAAWYAERARRRQKGAHIDADALRRGAAGGRYWRATVRDERQPASMSDRQAPHQLRPAPGSASPEPGDRPE